MLQALIFYVFAATAVGAGVMVISARNPVHSVLFLILAFFCLALFTNSDKEPEEQTDEKRTRNRIYRRCGWTIIGSLLAPASGGLSVLVTLVIAIVIIALVLLLLAVISYMVSESWKRMTTKIWDCRQVC